MPRLVVRVRDEPKLRALAVEAALQSVDPDVDTQVGFAMEGRTRQLEPHKIRATLGAVVGIGAMVLAVTGLFGVTTFVARQRLHEIGVRLTLGASRRNIVIMLLRSSLTPVAIGLVIGLGFALMSGRILQSALFGITPYDPVAIAWAVAILVAASLTAVLPTAYRAARVDLAGMLRAL